MAERGIGVGVIGCGWVAEYCHLPALRALPEARIVALADVDRSRADRLAAQFGVERACHSAAELLDIDAVEAVAVCVPTVDHVDVAIAALDAGKHVLIEKPLAVSLEAADRLAARAGASDRAAMVGFTLRWHHLIRKARAFLRAPGALPTVTAIHTTYAGPAAHPSGGWRADRSLGGGVLLERGTHHFDLWRFLLGAEVEEVFATTASGLEPERSAVVAARLSTGVVATATFTDEGVAANEVEIHIAGGRVRVSAYRFDGFQVT